MTAIGVVHELIDLSHDFVRSVQESDTDRLQELLGAEFTLQGAAGHLDRVQLIEAAAGPYEIDEFAYEEIEPEVYGNTAVVVSRYRQVGRFLGKELTHRMNVTDVWVRRDGGWRIVRRHATIAD